MKYRFALVLQMLIVFVGVGSTCAAELNRQTVAAWDNYIASAKRHMQDRLGGKSAFLRVDEDAMTNRRVGSGEIVISSLGDNHPVTVPQGLIHHWIGAVFIPGGTIQDLAALVDDYEGYGQIYRPALIKAERLDTTGDGQKFSILWVQRVLFATAAYYTELDSKFYSLNSRQGYMTFTTTRVQQIENYGEKDERRLAQDQGSGYLWRLVSVARFEERDGGLYLELEVIGLSKDIPGALRLLLKPVIDHLPRQALATTLFQTRQAIRSRAVTRLSSASLSSAP